MRAALVSAAVVISFFSAALANTEKTIFLGPEAVNVPLAHPSALSDLRLRTLTPTNNTLRTRLPARFPSADQPQGPATWLLLDHLTPNRRYEVRVCWPATQPTDFTVSTFPLATVWDTPELMASLRAYSVSRQSLAPEGGPPPPGSGSGSGNGSDSGTGERAASVLLLRILAAADYYTTDASLMRSVPPVDVDIILDPFLFNLLPRSLGGTACYIVAVAVAAYLLSRRIVSGIHGLIASADADVRQEAIKKRQ